MIWAGSSSHEPLQARLRRPGLRAAPYPTHRMYRYLAVHLLPCTAPMLHALLNPSQLLPTCLPQDHTQADKIAKIQKDLDETKIILHQTIDSVLKRGEKLDALVDKSNDLSLASQMFYKRARQTNSCCRFM